VMAFELGPGRERRRVGDAIHEDLAVEVIDLVLERAGLRRMGDGILGGLTRSARTAPCALRRAYIQRFSASGRSEKA